MYEKVKGDADLMRYFEGHDVESIVKSQCKYFSAACGGPEPWTGRTLKQIHKGMGITQEVMNKYADYFEQAGVESGKTPEEAAAIKKLILGFSAHVRGAHSNTGLTTEQT